MANAATPSRTKYANDPTSTTPLLKSNALDNGQSEIDLEHLEDKWNAEDNVQNPRNWSSLAKWLTVALVSFIEFLTTMPNFMYAPNIGDAQHDLKTDDDTLATLSLTIYVLGFGLGPLLFSPLSEMYGRAAIYRGCLTVFLAFTAGCALSTNINTLIVMRFLAGCFGAAPVAIGGAVVGDLFETSERGKAMSVYQAGQIISAVVGPPVGGLCGKYLDWTWTFWIVCILTTVALLGTLVVLRETHAPTLKRSIYGYPRDAADKSLAYELSHALSRPLKLLTRSPVVFACCVLIFLVIGILNVFLTNMSRVYQKLYSFTSAESGYIYIGLASGFVIASVVFGLTNDRIMSSLSHRHNGEAQPEFRLPATIVAMPTIVIGLLWYGWTLQFRAHWVVPTIGSAVAGLGVTTVQLSSMTYLVDSFDEFSASALAAATLARSVGGAAIPLLGPVLYRILGQGWGNTVFASVTAVCCVIPVMLYRYGSRWRAMFSTDDL